jgi:hypothetical protein
LVDSHHLQMSLRERLIRVLVFVDATVVQQPQEAVEEMKAQELAIAVCNDGVVIVTLKDVQELGEDGEIARSILILRCLGKGI